MVPDLLIPYVYSVNNFVAQMLRQWFCMLSFHSCSVGYHKQHICEVVLYLVLEH